MSTRDSDLTEALGGLLIILTLVLWFIGYVWNIAKIIALLGLTDPSVGLIIIRVLGVFVPPFGGIIGYF